MAKNLKRELPCLISLLSGCEQQTHPKRPKVMTGNGQLTRGPFMINDFLRNPHFKRLAHKVEKILKSSLDSIPSPSSSVKILIVGGKVCLRCKG